MKIIRYLDSTQQPHFAAQNADGTSFQIDGDIFGDFSVTKHPALVAKLLAPIVPSQILCVGLNYRKHAQETNANVPEYPVLFVKNAAAVQIPAIPFLFQLTCPAPRSIMNANWRS